MGTGWRVDPQPPTTILLRETRRHLQNLNDKKTVTRNRSRPGEELTRLTLPSNSRPRINVRYSRDKALRSVAPSGEPARRCSLLVQHRFEALASMIFKIRRKMHVPGDARNDSCCGSPLQRYDLAAVALTAASEQNGFRRLPPLSGRGGLLQLPQVHHWYNSTHINNFLFFGALLPGHGLPHLAIAVFPKTVGVFMACAGVCWLITTWPSLAHATSTPASPGIAGLVGEGTLMGYLIIRRRGRPTMERGQRVATAGFLICLSLIAVTSTDSPPALRSWFLCRGLRRAAKADHFPNSHMGFRPASGNGWGVCNGTSSRFKHAESVPIPPHSKE